MPAAIPVQLQRHRKLGQVRKGKIGRPEQEQFICGLGIGGAHQIHGNGWMGAEKPRGEVAVRGDQGMGISE